MRAPQTGIAEIERVVHRARRMVRRKIQCLEVVPVVLDLWTVGTLVAEPRKDRSDALERAGDRMDATALAVASRQADAELLGGAPPIQLGLFQYLLAQGQCIGQSILDPIDLGSARLALIRRQRTERLQRSGDDA